MFVHLASPSCPKYPPIALPNALRISFFHRAYALCLRASPLGDKSSAGAGPHNYYLRFAVSTVPGCRSSKALTLP